MPSAFTNAAGQNAATYSAPAVKWGSYNSDHLSPEVRRVIDDAQKLLSFPITVTSGYRDPARNAAANGAKDSMHMRGMAVDLSVKGLSDNQRTQLTQALVQSGGKRIGAYTGNTALHVDMKDQAAPAGYDAYPMMDSSASNMGSAPTWLRNGLTTGAPRVISGGSGGSRQAASGPPMPQTPSLALQQGRGMPSSPALAAIQAATGGIPIGLPGSGLPGAPGMPMPRPFSPGGSISPNAVPRPVPGVGGGGPSGTPTGGGGGAAPGTPTQPGTPAPGSPGGRGSPREEEDDGHGNGNPDYPNGAPIPRTQSPGLAARRAATPPTYPAPIPHTQSAALAALRAATPPTYPAAAPIPQMMSAALAAQRAATPPTYPVGARPGEILPAGQGNAYGGAYGSPPPTFGVPVPRSGEILPAGRSSAYGGGYGAPAPTFGAPTPRSGEILPAGQPSAYGGGYGQPPPAFGATRSPAATPRTILPVQQGSAYGGGYGLPPPTFGAPSTAQRVAAAGGAGGAGAAGSSDPFGALVRRSIGDSRPPAMVSGYGQPAPTFGVNGAGLLDRFPSLEDVMEVFPPGGTRSSPAPITSILPAGQGSAYGNGGLRVPTFAPASAASPAAGIAGAADSAWLNASQRPAGSTQGQGLIDNTFARLGQGMIDNTFASLQPPGEDIAAGEQAVLDRRRAEALASERASAANALPSSPRIIPPRSVTPMPDRMAMDRAPIGSADNIPLRPYSPPPAEPRPAPMISAAPSLPPPLPPVSPYGGGYGLPAPTFSPAPPPPSPLRLPIPDSFPTPAAAQLAALIEADRLKPPQTANTKAVQADLPQSSFAGNVALPAGIRPAGVPPLPVTPAPINAYGGAYGLPAPSFAAATPPPVARTQQAPIPATMSTALAASRNAVQAPIPPMPAKAAPIPATMSTSLAAKRKAVQAVEEEPPAKAPKRVVNSKGQEADGRWREVYNNDTGQFERTWVYY